jgi:hypothetical protein
MAGKNSFESSSGGGKTPLIDSAFKTGVGAQRKNKRKYRAQSTATD